MKAFLPVIKQRNERKIYLKLSIFDGGKMEELFGCICGFNLTLMTGYTSDLLYLYT
jgi:hypothetical protein